jgi:hypothetical protein
MSRASLKLAEARAARDEAREAFDAQLLRLRGDPQAQTIGERLLERVSDDARHALDRTLDVAAESKGIAAATAALLALWFLRGPILELVGGLWEANFGADEEFDEADVTD